MLSHTQYYHSCQPVIFVVRFCEGYVMYGRRRSRKTMGGQGGDKSNEGKGEGTQTFAIAAAARPMLIIQQKGPELKLLSTIYGAFCFALFILQPWQKICHRFCSSHPESCFVVAGDGIVAIEV